jgi:energy-coupling factor transport system permease protein
MYPDILIPVGKILIRIYLLMLFTMLFTSTTKPTAITMAIESLLRPFKVVKFPVEEVALIISIALRFIPTILEETGMIMNAQASRGVDFSNGNLRQKAKSIATLVIPMFANSFQRADDLANAIEARGYVIGEPRTKYNPFKLTFMDVVMFLAMVGLLVVIILIMHDVIPMFIDNVMNIPI